MKKFVAANNASEGRRILTENNKNIALKKGNNARPAAGQNKTINKPAIDTVTLTQSELDALLGAVGKLSMEKGE